MNEDPIVTSKPVAMNEYIEWYWQLPQNLKPKLRKIVMEYRQSLGHTAIDKDLKDESKEWLGYGPHETELCFLEHIKSLTIRISQSLGPITLIYWSNSSSAYGLTYRDGALRDTAELVPNDEDFMSVEQWCGDDYEKVKPLLRPYMCDESWFRIVRS